MEILLTVSITLLIVLIAYTFFEVISLKRKVDDIDIIKLDLCDFEDKIYNMIEDLENRINRINQDNTDVNGKIK